jgi:hypoxanthine phosphoribosyltransferase
MQKKKAKPAVRKHAAKKRPAPPRPAALAADGLKVVFSEARIDKRVREMADQINRDYRGKTLHVVGILENSIMFAADLVRRLKVPTICRYVRAEARDGRAGNAPVREISYTPRVDPADKDILVLDTILQSGVTLDHLCRTMMAQNARSVRTAMLVEKTDERKVDVSTDYVGFRHQGKFLVGYGLGYQDRYRNLPFIATLP